MPMPEPLSDAELGAIASRVDAATPGPWFVRLLGDDWAMNLVAVATSPDTDRSEHWPAFHSNEMVAATLVQHPRFIDIADERWDQNADFIANARTDIPRLIADIKRLRELLADQ